MLNEARAAARPPSSQLGELIQKRPVESDLRLNRHLAVRCCNETLRSKSQLLRNHDIATLQLARVISVRQSYAGELDRDPSTGQWISRVTDLKVEMRLG